jgi:hypothetical protein
MVAPGTPTRASLGLHAVAGFGVRANARAEVEEEEALLFFAVHRAYQDSGQRRGAGFALTF